MEIKAEGNISIWIEPPQYEDEYRAHVVTHNFRPAYIGDNAWLEKVTPFEYIIDVDPKEAVGKQVEALESQLEEKKSEYMLEKKMLQEQIASLLCIEAGPE